MASASGEGSGRKPVVLVAKRPVQPASKPGQSHITSVAHPYRATASSCITKPRVTVGGTGVLPTEPGTDPKLPSIAEGAVGKLLSTHRPNPVTRQLSEDEAYLQKLQKARVSSNQEYHERVKGWYARLLYYRANPQTLEFSYMVLAEPGSVVYRPYDLLVVPHSKVTREFYYTISAEGVTHFHGKDTTHMSLDEFERAYFLYKQVAQMHFFSRFRLWKAFRLWRAHICRSKATHACQHLSKRLFHLHPQFGPCLKALVLSCERLQQQSALVLLSRDQPTQLEELQVMPSVDTATLWPWYRHTDPGSMCDGEQSSLANEASAGVLCGGTGEHSR